jgi:uncharacterized protein (DUF433 family)
MDDLLKRITFEDGKNGGRASIRNMRLRVHDILELLAEGVPESEIIEEFPELEPDDIRACLAYAAAVTGDSVIVFA